MPTERNSELQSQQLKAPEPKAHLRPRPFRLKVHGWLRWLHTYISIFSCIAILFFALTGVALNHPDWKFTNSESKSTSTGQMPAAWKKGERDVDWFIVDEFLRKQDHVVGTATSKDADESEASITFEAPGYTAECFIDTKKGSYELTLTKLGVVGVLDDFHRGKNSGKIWPWVLDFSGYSLSLVALTGLGLLWYLKKIRIAGYIVMVIGFLLAFIAMGMAF